MLDDDDSITLLPEERFGEELVDERFGEPGFKILVRCGDVVEVGRSKTRIAADGGSLDNFLS